jgi:hypothetical protein
MTVADMQYVIDAFAAAAKRAAVAGCAPCPALALPNSLHFALTKWKFPSRFHRDSRSPRISAPLVPLPDL